MPYQFILPPAVPETVHFLTVSLIPDIIELFFLACPNFMGEGFHYHFTFYFSDYNEVWVAFHIYQPAIFLYTRNSSF